MSKNLLIDVAKSKSSANKAAKDLAIGELEKAVYNLQAALRKKVQQEEKKATAREAALKKIKLMMAEAGVSAEDLSGGGPAKEGNRRTGKKRRVKVKRGPLKGKKVAPKYQIKVNGQSYKWTGRGRMPVVFRDFLEKNGSLEKCLIKQ